MAPATLQANPGMPAIDTIQTNLDMPTTDTTYFSELLFEGIENSDLNRVILGKMGGALIGALNEAGNTFLIEAVKKQDIDAIHYLIQQRANINQKTRQAMYPYIKPLAI
jgi:hypothetical protein